MKNIFQDKQTEAVILADAANTFNVVNRKAFLHNINKICPSIPTFVHNYYTRLSRLFVIGVVEIVSSEGTTQGDNIIYCLVKKDKNHSSIRAIIKKSPNTSFLLKTISKKDIEE